MATPKIEFPYVPNVREIIGRLEYMDHIPVEDVDLNDSYTQFLVNQGAVVKKNGFYEICNDWKEILGQDESKKMHQFQNLISDIKICNDIIDEISKTDCTYEGLLKTFQSIYHEQDIRVVISWLEYLRQIGQKDGKITVRLDDSEYEDERPDGIYPMNSDTEINVKEDKMSVFEYLRKIERGLIVMDPDFQRHLVWKNSQKSMFIESAILNIPVPPIYLKRIENNQMIVVDGLQRTNALVSFFQEGLELEGLNALTKLNGECYDSMDKNDELNSLITRIEDKQLNFFILQQDIPMSIVYDIFNRINTGGTQLERQEIRNCILLGKSTKLLKRISESKRYKDAIGYGISPRRMKDREAALRCIAFTILDHSLFKGSIDDFLEVAMKKMNRMSDIEVDDIYNIFTKVMHCSYDIFGDANFRIPTDYTRGRINIAVMETVYYCLFHLTKGKAPIKKSNIRASFNEMLNDEDYLEAVRNSTGSKYSVNERFAIAKKYLMGK